jgi:hypothetical protein
LGQRTGCDGQAGGDRGSQGQGTSAGHTVVSCDLGLCNTVIVHAAILQIQPSRRKSFRATVPFCELVDNSFVYLAEAASMGEHKRKNQMSR